MGLTKFSFDEKISSKRTTSKAHIKKKNDSQSDQIQLGLFFIHQYLSEFSRFIAIKILKLQNVSVLLKQKRLLVCYEPFIIMKTDS